MRCVLCLEECIPSIISEEQWKHTYRGIPLCVAYAWLLKPMIMPSGTHWLVSIFIPEERKKVYAQRGITISMIHGGV